MANIPQVRAVLKAECLHTARSRGILVYSPIYYPPLRPVRSRWLALASYSSPNPLAPLYCVIDLLIVYSMCNSVLSVHTALLYLGQVAIVNDNLFSTCLPG
jgi:hypothetical protein